MAEANQPTFRIRRIERRPRTTANTRSFNSTTGRIRYIIPKSGDFFTDKGLAEAVPPPGAQSYKVVRRDDRYVRPDNPLGLMTEGPFDLSISAYDLIQGSRFTADDIAKIIYDIAD